MLIGLIACGQSDNGSVAGESLASETPFGSETASESVRKPKGNYITAILGDSLTDKGVYSDIVTEHYTDYLYEHCPFIENIQNLGYAGSCIAGLPDKEGKTSPSFVERCNQIKANVNLVIVFGGTNDYGIGSSTLPNPLGTYGDESPETFYGGLFTLINNIEKDHLNAKIVFVTPIYRREQEMGGIPYKNKYGFTLDEYAAAITETCEKRGICCIDAFNGLNEINADTYEEYEVDGLHLNNEGNILLGKYLAEELAKILD